MIKTSFIYFNLVNKQTFKTKNLISYILKKYFIAKKNAIIKCEQ